jgi:hypothetical protein
VPSATAILDRFLHHAEIITITGKSYRLRNQPPPDAAADSKPANAPTGSSPRKRPRTEAETTTASQAAACES